MDAVARASPVRPMSPSREGLFLLGSEPYFGREEAWKSFNPRRWLGKESSNKFACVCGHRLPYRFPLCLPGSKPNASQLCSISPGGRLCPCLLPFAHYISAGVSPKRHQLAKKKGSKPAEGAEPGGLCCEHCVCSLPRRCWVSGDPRKHWGYDKKGYF